MARVFVSYRRTDGIHAVGWLTERLRALDVEIGDQTAFHDERLRPGSDLATALDLEIGECDVVVAVITPAWRGEIEGRTSRIEDPDDWIVREIAGALAQGKRIVPVLVGDAPHPLASEMHESIAGLSRLLSVPFREADDLDRIVDEVDALLDEVDRDRALRLGLESPVQAPVLAHPWLLGVGAAVTGLSLAALLGWSNGSSLGASEQACRVTGGEVCATATRAWDWFVALMVVLGAFAGPVTVVGSVLAVRIVRLSTVRWRPLAGYTALVATTMLLLAATIPNGHMALADVAGLPNAGGRLTINIAVFVVTALGIGICAVLPVLAAPRADATDVPTRVRWLAIARDAERWGSTMLAAHFSVVAASATALTASFERAGADDVDTSPVGSLAFALVFSTILIVVHRWAVASLTQERDRIDALLVGLPPRYRANATPKMAVRSLDDGGWGFRAFLALPLIVVVIGAVVVAA